MAEGDGAVPQRSVGRARLILVEGYIQSSPGQVRHLVALRMFDRSHDLIGLANDALSASIGRPQGPRWSNRSTTIAASIRIIPRKKSATRATSASCRRHGIFIEPLFSDGVTAGCWPHTEMKSVREAYVWGTGISDVRSIHMTCGARLRIRAQIRHARPAPDPALQP